MLATPLCLRLRADADAAMPMIFAAAIRRCCRHFFSPDDDTPFAVMPLLRF